MGTAKKSCNGDVGGCVWMEGYPPLAFSEDSDYQLLAEESFFAIDGSVVEMIGNMDSNMLMLFGVMFVAVLLKYLLKPANEFIFIIYIDKIKQLDLFSICYA